MDKTTFLNKFGSVFEDSPWVAEAVFETGVDALLTNAKALSARFKSVFIGPDPELQLATLRAHPQLACALADPVDLTEASLIEQTGAGLNQCSEAEFEEFVRLNAAYIRKFGFPFIIAVRGRQRQKIMNLFRMRLKNDAVTEYLTALDQACRIAGFRIGNILNA
jgi:OHCU decarboxylase